MDSFVLMQLKQVAEQIGWTLVIVKDEDENVVMVTLGEDEWIEEFYGE